MNRKNTASILEGILTIVEHLFFWGWFKIQVDTSKSTPKELNNFQSSRYVRYMHMFRVLQNKRIINRI